MTGWLVVVSWQLFCGWHFPPLEHSVILTKLCNEAQSSFVACEKNESAG